MNGFESTDKLKKASELTTPTDVETPAKEFLITNNKQAVTGEKAF